MRVDVEGAEFLVLMGAVNTINRFHPIIFFEENGLTINNSMVKSMNIDFKYETARDFLLQLGYNVTNIDFCNCIAIHSTRT